MDLTTSRFFLSRNCTVLFSRAKQMNFSFPNASYIFTLLANFFWSSSSSLVKKYSWNLLSYTTSMLKPTNLTKVDWASNSTSCVGNQALSKFVFSLRTAPIISSTVSSINSARSFSVVCYFFCFKATTSASFSYCCFASDSCVVIFLCHDLIPSRTDLSPLFLFYLICSSACLICFSLKIASSLKFFFRSSISMSVWLALCLYAMWASVTYLLRLITSSIISSNDSLNEPSVRPYGLSALLMPVFFFAEFYFYCTIAFNLLTIRFCLGATLISSSSLGGSAVVKKSSSAGVLLESLLLLKGPLLYFLYDILWLSYSSKSTRLFLNFSCSLYTSRAAMAFYRPRLSNIKIRVCCKSLLHISTMSSNLSSSS